MAALWCDPFGPTCNDRTIDFFVVFNEMAHAVVGAWVVGDGGAKPHCPVRLVIKAKPNSIMMKTLKPPMAIGADLLFGPIPFYEKPEQMEARGFVGGVAKVEEQLSHLLGLTSEEAAKTQGRAGGSRFAWRPALGKCDTSRARATSVSRAWRKTDV